MTLALLLAVGSQSAPALGFLVIVSLCVATYLLYRSLTKQLRRVPKSFDDKPEDGAEPKD
ncbi:MAG: hypothetical protein M3Z02_10920 [Actinomycetota bacterium]|nr:hypothetical protein [Actinomycetota bacterium]